ncbi:MAG TPA: hypothetical protein VGC08_10395 [Pedobacter sp.]
MNIAETTVKRILERYVKDTDKVFDLIDQSFMSDDYKTGYKNIWTERTKRLS